MKVIKENNEWKVTENVFTKVSQRSDFFKKITELYKSSKMKIAGGRIVMFKGYLTMMMQYDTERFVMDSLVKFDDAGYYSTRVHITGTASKFDLMNAKTNKVPKRYSFLAKELRLDKVPENKKDAEDIIKEFTKKNKSKLINIPEK